MLASDAIRDLLSRQKPRRITRENFRRAAVLVPIYWRDEQPHMVFTQRSVHVPHHKGQIAFPGGSIDLDDPDELTAALRETEEELGIPRSQVELLGALDDIITVTHFVVSPFVARIPVDFPYRPSEFEIAEVFDVPLAELADPTRLREQTVSFEERPYPIYYFDHGGRNIWGATGKILRQFLAVTELMPGDVVSDDSLPTDL